MPTNCRLWSKGKKTNKGPQKTRKKNRTEKRSRHLKGKTDTLWSSLSGPQLLSAYRSGSNAAHSICHFINLSGNKKKTTFLNFISRVKKFRTMAKVKSVHIIQAFTWLNPRKTFTPHHQKTTGNIYPFVFSIDFQYKPKIGGGVCATGIWCPEKVYFCNLKFQQHNYAESDVVTSGNKNECIPLAYANGLRTALVQRVPGISFQVLLQVFL